MRLLEAVAPTRLVTTLATWLVARLPTRLIATLAAWLVARLPTRLVIDLDGLLLTLVRCGTVLLRRTPLQRPIPLIATIAVATITISTIPVATAAFPVAAIPTAETALVAPVGPVVAVGVVPSAGVARLMLWLMWLLLRLRHGALMLRREPFVQDVLAFIVAELVATIARQAMAVAVGHIARLLQLLAIGHDDAHIVLGVLQIILRQHRVAGRLSIARESQILLGDMRRRAPDFHIRSIGFETAR